MDNNIINIQTIIPIKNIINNVIINEPKNKCEFNNLLLLEFSKIFFDNLEKQQQLILNKGGSKNKTNKKTKLTKLTKLTKRTKRTKLTKRSKTNKNKITKMNKLRKRSQKGGADPRIIMFFVSLFFIFSKAIKNMTDK